MAEHVERIGRRIKEARTAAGLSQREVAFQMPGSTDASQVSRWERGKHEPEPEAKEALARVLGVKVESFYVDSKPNGTSPDPFGDVSAEEDVEDLRTMVIGMRRELRALAAAVQRLSPAEPGEHRGNS